MAFAPSPRLSASSPPGSPRLLPSRRSPRRSSPVAGLNTTPGSTRGPRTVVSAGNLPDHDSIVALSQSCSEDADVKQREKSELVKISTELKKKTQYCDARITKKQKEVDKVIVQAMEIEKKTQGVQTCVKTLSAELAGTRADNDRLAQDIEHLKADLKEATANYEKECAEVERLQQLLHSQRKEITMETKQRDNVNQDLRASRTAQNLMINRLDHMEKKNRALKICVANTFNP